MKKWWHDKVAYQIYPKSFCDSNGDGIGDLKGIISKLDYLKDLGVDIIWLSPIYCSPLVDQGYDISDYYNIDPRFGTMEDMDELLRQAKKRNMYILMDLVVNHCSDKHEWFKKALDDPEGEYADYFYIREGKGDNPPCNWRSYFGGSVWEKIPNTNKYYLHLFAKEQPDLNWENPKLKNEIFKMVNWWLEKGLAGFRIDAIINIKKDLRFQDFPADREDGLCSIDRMLEAAEGVGNMLHELKEKTFEKFDAFTVGEVFNRKEGELDKFIGEDGYFSSIFDFEMEVLGKSEFGWYDNKPFSINELRKAIFNSQLETSGVGFKANIIENHDEPRGVSRYIPEQGLNDRSKKMLGAISLMLRGIPFIYQGQEIGMTNNKFNSIKEFDDIATIDQYNVAIEKGYSDEEALKIINIFSRDNARTPFQWSGSENAGFTTGRPWLKVNENYKVINANLQIEDEESVFNFYKKLINLRKSEEFKDAIVYGEFVPTFEEYDNLFAFYRQGESKKLMILANYQKEEQIIELDKQYVKVLINNCEEIKKDKNKIILQGYQVLILEV
ncbi:alpha-glucosidase [Clostridium beijerinckii]|mgnify:CR=1 FL=1|jgi:Glycosidases|uniref:Alpha-glucosidase n=2 Tax=Clostridium beijerinckii TaxID=1520 RepID=A0AAE2RUV3_CLOBE|nr:alpha-glucosidase [Clostridium beijerinckii]ABR33622.1 alpha amylase, catalytic region [Clostridium beijerinckii NCIMB 8052]AIU01761.1 alpha amylase, catalytic region [Clostridium beijerinckii ATCC 35702]MBF7812038.1 alpha-glucosidase [Clostridium beijerinckii]NRT25107.1 oligo-1,6-glucosidase [Clostridium beijerinckii]NRT67299.1 oligo-1,6-glucosidase [Clostridium beijerinckii]